jgi:putative ABC transport system permease protein
MQRTLVYFSRNIFKNKVNSVINLVGLTIALCSLIIIMLWIREELSYDRFHSNAHHIYRIVSGNPSDKEAWAGSPSPLGPFLKEDFPEVFSYSRYELISATVRKDQNVLFYENRIAVADTSFFNIFSFPLVRGTKRNAMQKENFILLSESVAARYFGTTDPIGKTLVLADSMNYEVTGVFRDIPATSHIHFDFLMRFESVYKSQSWDEWNYFTYLLLNQGVDVEAFKQKTIQWAEKNRPDQVEALKEINYQPLSQIHFQFNRKNHETTVDKTSIQAAMLVALLILIIACINFANLSTLQSFERAKEIAVRKIMGESRRRLRLTLIAEAVIISSCSLFLAAILVENSLPIFNRLLESNLSFTITDRSFILIAVGLVLITGVLSGTYPAFILSSFKPTDLFSNSYKLKGKQSTGTILVIAQFSISIILMLCLFAINRQMEYVRSKKLGMNSENVVNIRLQCSSMAKHAKELREELLKNPGVVAASVNSYRPSQLNEHWGLSFNEKTNNGSDENEGLWIIIADKYFCKTMQLDVLEGEDMINNYSADKIPFILNESAAALIKDGNVIGRTFDFFGGNKGRIIGKVKDFHFRSLHHKIEPAAIILVDMGDQISVKVKTSDMKATLASLEKTWNRFSPDLKFDYYFMDEDLNHLYQSEIRTNKLLITAGGLSMFLCCLGIFGIVAYSTKKRTKEIGIRKVHGSTSIGIMMMLSAKYSRWIIIAIVIACPIGYYIMYRWLQNFAYKTTLAWWLFAAAGIIAYLIALLTVFWRSWNVARKDPVEALRYE